jgi:hypothetical protein
LINLTLAAICGHIGDEQAQNPDCAWGATLHPRTQSAAFKNQRDMLDQGLKAILHCTITAAQP